MGDARIVRPDGTDKAVCVEEEEGSGTFSECWGLWDADGDGSDWIQCTAKDTPVPSCKGPEWVYLDFADDLTAALWRRDAAGNDLTFGLATGATLHLREAVYVVIPCWKPATTIDLSDPTTRDDTGDAAFGDCVLGSDGVRIWGPVIGNKDIRIVGAGTDERRNDQDIITARGTGRDRGTTIAYDTGNRLDDWFGAEARGLLVGLNLRVTDQPRGASIFTTGDAVGYGDILLTESVASRTGDPCICDDTACGAPSTGWTDNLQDGDLCRIITPVKDGLGTFTASTVRVRRDSGEVYPSCSTGGTRVQIGGIDDPTSASANHRWNIGHALDYVSSTGLGRMACGRTDALGGRFRLENLRLEPQDYWNEPGGDCSETGLWNSPGDDADPDCDTGKLVSYEGYGAGELTDLVVSNWHNFAFDAGTTSETSVRRVDFLFGNGGPIQDPLGTNDFQDFTIDHSGFSTNVFGGFGSGYTLRNGRVRNSSFQGFLDLEDGDRHVVIEDIDFDGVAFDQIIFMGCGATDNRIEQINVSGRFEARNASGTGLLRVFCTDATNPIERNVFRDWFGDSPNITSSERLVQLRDDGNLGAIQNNLFESFHHPAAGAGACIFSIEDEGDDGLLAINTFVNNSVTADAGRVFCNCTNNLTCLSDPTTVAFGSGNSIGTGASRVPDPFTDPLGGALKQPLDVNGNAITSSSDGDVAIDPDGTGIVDIQGDTDITGTLTFDGGTSQAIPCDTGSGCAGAIATEDVTRTAIPDDPPNTLLKDLEWIDQNIGGGGGEEHFYGFLDFNQARPAMWTPLPTGANPTIAVGSVNDATSRLVAHYIPGGKTFTVTSFSVAHGTTGTITGGCRIELDFSTDATESDLGTLLGQAIYVGNAASANDSCEFANLNTGDRIQAAGEYCTHTFSTDVDGPAWIRVHLNDDSDASQTCGVPITGLFVDYGGVWN